MSAAGEEGSFQNIYHGDAYRLYEDRPVVNDHAHVGVPFPLLDGERVIYLGCASDFSHYPIITLSNYRIFVAYQDTFCNVPLGLVDTVEVRSSSELILSCFDAQQHVVTFYSESQILRWRDRLLEVLGAPRRVKDSFAFVHRAEAVDRGFLGRRDGGREESEGTHNGLAGRDRPDKLVEEEFNRLGMRECGQWKITESNVEFKLCSTYPKLLVVPMVAQDQQLEEAAKFRVNGRIPTVVWRHHNGCVLLRSSQPKVGWFSWRNAADEKLLLQVSLASSATAPSLLNANGLLQPGSDEGREKEEEEEQEEEEEEEEKEEEEEEVEDCTKKLVIFDLRAYMACLGNRAKGGGTENPEYYSNCEVQYKGLANIHDVYRSFSDLRSLLASNIKNFWSSLEGTNWLHYVSQLLAVAVEVGEVLVGGAPALVHCSDGWDRTPQVVSLTKIIMDPYYRTMEGFQFLIEREWLSFGHQFALRRSFLHPDQNSPVFLQWLDCIHQLLKQFPCHFEFNESFLLLLVRHSYSSLYGTFLGDAVKERVDNGVYTHTTSLWSAVQADAHLYQNLLYIQPSGMEVLPVQSDVRHMLLWRRLFLPNRCVSFPPVSHASKEEEEEGLAFTSLTDDEGIPEESTPYGSWTPHLLTSEDGIPENLKMSRHETTTCDSEDHSPPASPEAASRGGAETQKSGCGSLQLDLTYINAVKHLLGRDGFEPIKDTVQEQLQSLRANRQKDAHQSQRSVKAHREAGPTVTSEKRDVQESRLSLGSWQEVRREEAEAVKWVPDHAAVSCMRCHNHFTLLRRKHHCRSCGGVFCYSCSDHFVPVQSQLLNTPVRVCDGCFDKMDGHLSQSQEEGLTDGLK